MASRTQVYTKTNGSSSAANIAASQAATAGVALNLNGGTVTNGVATIDTASAANTAPGVRVLITSTSATETASITITGTNAFGNAITETDTFSGSSTTLVSGLDYVTVTKIVPSGTIVGSLSAGTNGVGSAPWTVVSPLSDSPTNVGVGVEVVSGTPNYTVEYTYDDPNNLQGNLVYAIAFPSSLAAQSSTKDVLIINPVWAVRVTINSGTGEIRAHIVQAGIG